MREQLLKGNLYYPTVLLLSDSPKQTKDILAFWNAIWVNYLRKEETSGLYWYDQLGCKTINRTIRLLENHGWIISNSLPGRRWASVLLKTDKLLEFVTVDELLEIRERFQYQKYLLDCTEAGKPDLVKQNGKTKRTGLVRAGFRDSGNTQFGYDMIKLNEYKEAAKLNLTKSMDKIRQQYPDMYTDSASYDKISVGIYDWHYNNLNEVFTTGNNVSDARGRAISQSLCKVFNPISSKDARASLVITYG
jgi:hypothetical protein